MFTVSHMFCKKDLCLTEAMLLGTLLKQWSGHMFFWKVGVMGCSKGQVCLTVAASLMAYSI